MTSILGMTRILLDENIPFGLRRLLLDDHVVHATQLGWDGLSNGRLIDAAEMAGFTVMVTADRNLRYQQNLAGRRLALVVLSTNRWNVIRASADIVTRTVTSATPGSFVEVDLGR